MKESKGEVAIVSEKRVAADGTQRGLKRKGSKNKSTLLMEAMQQDAKNLFGIEEFDPVRSMNVIGLMAWQGYPAVDENGHPVVEPVLDETGQHVEENGVKQYRQVMVPPNHELALAAFAKVSPYVHSQLRPKDVGDDAEDQNDPEEVRDKVLSAFEQMGVKVVSTEKDSEE